MARHETFLNIAKELSNLSDFTKHKIGCVVVYKGTIISSAFNSNKTHTMQYRYNKYRDLEGDTIISKSHAEVAALSKIRYLDIDWSRVIVYVYRAHKSGIRAMARPCQACYQAIKEKGLQTIVYTTENGYAVEKI